LPRVAVQVRTHYHLGVIRGLHFRSFGFLVCALAGFPAAAATAEPLTVAVTLPPLACLAKRLAPPGTLVVTMMPPGSEEETFEPSPSQIAALQRVRLYFRVGHAGLPFEAKYVAPFLGEHPEVRVVTLSAGVALGRLDADADPSAAALGISDPHLWMSPEIMLRAAERLASAFQELVPSDGPGVKERLAALLTEVGTIEDAFRSAAATRPGAAFVAYHPTFGYLARDFGLRQIAVEVEGKEPGLASLVRLTLDARQAGVRVLFVTPGPAERNGRVLAESIGARLVAVDPLAESWLETLRTIALALTGPRPQPEVAAR